MAMTEHAKSFSPNSAPSPINSDNGDNEHSHQGSARSGAS